MFVFSLYINFAELVLIMVLFKIYNIIIIIIIASFLDVVDHRTYQLIDNKQWLSDSLSQLLSHLIFGYF